MLRPRHLNRAKRPAHRCNPLIIRRNDNLRQRRSPLALLHHMLHQRLSRDRRDRLRRKPRRSIPRRNDSDNSHHGLVIEFKKFGIGNFRPSPVPACKSIVKPPPAHLNLPMLFRLFLLLVASLQATHAAETNLIAIKAGRLIDVINGQVLEQQTILIEGDLIKQVGPTASLNIPANAKQIDLSQATVLPGLIDSLTHITSQPEDYYADIFRKTPIDIAITAHIFARRTLEAGFTTCRNLGADEFIDVALKKAIDSG